MRDTLLINGIEAGTACVDQRAFQFGDGLFETIAIVEGAPCLWERHMARLATGCQRLRLPPPDFNLLYDETRELARGHAQAVLKIYWTAGNSARGYRRPEHLKPLRALRLSAWPHPQTPGPWRVRFCEHRLSENPSLAGIKHLNRLDQVIARAEWEDAAIGEGVMLGQDGRVVCGSMSNLLLQSADRLLTPTIDGAGIAGVVRALAIDLAAQAGEPLVESRIDREQLRTADALYVCNSLIGVVRISALDQHAFDMDIAEHPLIPALRSACHRPESAA